MALCAAHGNCTQSGHCCAHLCGLGRPRPLRTVPTMSAYFSQLTSIVSIFFLLGFLFYRSKKKNFGVVVLLLYELFMLLYVAGNIFIEML